MTEQKEVEMSKKIDRGLYQKIVDEVEDMYGQTREQEEAIDMVDTLLGMLDIEVEEPSILPDITPGTWSVSEGYYCSSRHEKMYWNINKENGTFLAHMLDNEADAKLMVAAKELVQAVVECLEDRMFARVQWSPKSKAIIDALEKAGVNVEKFRR
jgi:hypothetical protein